MPLDRTALVAERISELILKRFEMRDSDRRLTPSEKRKIKTVAGLVIETGHDPMSTVKAFIDYTLPVTGKFKSPRNVYFEWNNFKAENLAAVSQLFPITNADEDLFSAFKSDWEAIGRDHTHLNHVYHRSFDVAPVKVTKLYRGTPDFWRVVGLIRYYKPECRQNHFPLFTMRSFLAAQVETLCQFIDRLKIGNLVSEKAHERYCDWYDRAFYPSELVFKAKKRPSANNPVCTSSIRREFECSRIASGSRAGIVTMEGESELIYHNVPMIFSEPIEQIEVISTGTSIVVPPSARE